VLSELNTPRPAQLADITEPRRGEGNRAPATKMSNGPLYGALSVFEIAVSTTQN
jgi:hypothetical protein